MKKYRGTKAVLVAIIAMILIIFPFFYGCSDDDDKASVAKARMDNVRSLNDPNVVITQVNIITEEGLPKYCRVRGYCLPSAHFEIRIPTDDWNGKFYMGGPSGFSGQTGFVCATNCSETMDAMNDPLTRGYAVAATDGGHWGEHVFDAASFCNNWRAKIEYAYYAVHKVAVAAKEIIEAFHGQAVTYSYYDGCSNGGRAGLKEAQMYPDDFDGIIVGSPAINIANFFGMGKSWDVQAMFRTDGTQILTGDDLIKICQIVYQECDGQDGSVDGIIDDPSKVSFDPDILLKNGFTPEQATALKKMYQGARNSNGDQLAPGWAIGSETQWIGAKVPGKTQWGYFDVALDDDFPCTSFDTDPEYFNYLTYNFDTDPDDPKYSNKKMKMIFNADSTDLRAFQQRGGKLIIYHGWTDPYISPYSTIEYYDSVVAEMGGPEQVQDFFRCYMIPGKAHCAAAFGISAPQEIDYLGLMVDWVENGIAPGGVEALQLDEAGNIEATRVINPYPLAPGVVKIVK